jgi:Uma2 family endonuclease
MATVTHPEVSNPAALNSVSPVVLRFEPPLSMTGEQFWEFCRQNPDLRIERSAIGEVLLMAPAGSLSGDLNSEIGMQLRIWAKRNGTGKAFDSSTGFTLPNSAVLSPDASWVLYSRWNQLTKSEQSQFAPLCPDFVLELRSPSDRITMLQEKLEEYLANGARLGWIIDPLTKSVHIYRPNREPEILTNPKAVSGEDVLPGFELDLSEIFPAA